MSRIEKILQAIIDETSYSEEPQSRIEEILLAVKNNVPYTKLSLSRIEEILLTIKNNASYDKESMSRIEEILIAKLKGLEYTKLPQSRIEELLIKWIKREIEFEGVPPLTYKAIEGALKNYRIYGQTADGESVGDLVTSGEHAGEYKVPVTVSNGTDTLTIPIYLPEQIRKVGDEAEYIDYGEQKQHRVRKNLFDKNSYKVSGYVSDNGTIIISGSVEISTFDYIKVTAQKLYSFKAFSSTTPSEYQRTVRVAYYDKNKNYLSRIVKIGAGLEGFSFETPVNCQYIRLSIDENLFDNMLVKGNLIPIEYEPFIEDTELDAVLPALPTIAGTNVLTVGTAVQPSKVHVKYKGG